MQGAHGSFAPWVVNTSALEVTITGESTLPINEATSKAIPNTTYAVRVEAANEAGIGPVSVSRGSRCALA